MVKKRDRRLEQVDASPFPLNPRLSTGELVEELRRFNEERAIQLNHEPPSRGKRMPLPYTGVGGDTPENEIDAAHAAREKEKGIRAIMIVRMKRSKTWVNLNKVARFIAGDGSLAEAFSQLGQSIEEGEFVHGGRTRIISLHPEPGVTWGIFTPDRYRELGYDLLQRASDRDAHLLHCWIPLQLARCWFEARRLALPPWLIPRRNLAEAARDRQDEQRKVGRPGVKESCLLLFERRRQQGEPLGQNKLAEARAICSMWPNQREAPQDKTVAKHIGPLWENAKQRL